ncbi:hypothetical protein K502DRAFT_352141 [Neoconidiobolus thromboides FSU 785]|nr:hypothetical protein K502DRAFT_352141 [Neoconidiobolus thromboides FSU 785]
MENHNVKRTKFEREGKQKAPPRLPLELMHNIFEYLGNQDIVDWICLNKAMFEYFIPIIYKEITTSSRIDMGNINLEKYGNHIKTINMTNEENETNKIELLFKLNQLHPGTIYNLKCTYEVAKALSQYYCLPINKYILDNFKIIELYHPFNSIKEEMIPFSMPTSFSKNNIINGVEKVVVNKIKGEVNTNYLEYLSKDKIKYIYFNTHSSIFLRNFPEQICSFHNLNTLKIKSKGYELNVRSILSCKYPSLETLYLEIQNYHMIEDGIRTLLLDSYNFPILKKLMLHMAYKFTFTGQFKLLNVLYLTTHAQLDELKFDFMLFPKLQALHLIREDKIFSHTTFNFINAEKSELKKLAFHNIIFTDTYFNYLSKNLKFLKVLYLDNSGIDSSEDDTVDNSCFMLTLRYFIYENSDSTFLNWYLSHFPNLKYLFCKKDSIEHINEQFPSIVCLKDLFDPYLKQFTFSFQNNFLF